MCSLNLSFQALYNICMRTDFKFIFLILISNITKILVTHDIFFVVRTSQISNFILLLNASYHIVTVIFVQWCILLDAVTGGWFDNINLQYY